MVGLIGVTLTIVDLTEIYKLKHLWVQSGHLVLVNSSIMSTEQVFSRIFSISKWYSHCYTANQCNTSQPQTWNSDRQTFSLLSLQEVSWAPGSCITSIWIWQARPEWFLKAWEERIPQREVSLWMTLTCHPQSALSTSGTSATSPNWWPPRQQETSCTARASCHQPVTPSRWNPSLNDILRIHWYSFSMACS